MTGLDNANSVKDGNFDKRPFSAPPVWVETLLCSRCLFCATLPEGLRIHQLLGCSSEAPNELHTRLATQPDAFYPNSHICNPRSSHLSAKYPQLLNQLLANRAAPPHGLRAKDTVVPHSVNSATHAVIRSKQSQLNSIFSASIAKILLCNFCSFLTLKPKTLRLHQLLGCYILHIKHTESNSCISQTTVTSRKCQLAATISSLILKPSSQKRLNRNKTVFSCDVCSYMCSQRCHLRQHKLTHTGEKPFSCNSCSFKCSQFSHLKQHKLTHTGEKSFRCDTCSFKCSRSNNLNTHKLTHTSERPLSCDSCSYKCFQIFNLKQHKLIHTGEKPFSCDTCSYKCRQLSNLKRHKLTHAGDKFALLQSLKS